MILKFLLPLSSLLIVGCSSISVSNDFDPNVKIEHFATYNFANTPHVGEDQLTYNRITSAIQRVLKNKCYRYNEGNATDMSILIHLNVTDKQRVVSDYQYVGMYPYRYGAGMMQTTRTIDYQEGQLIIDFFNLKKSETFYRANATDRIKELDSPKERERYINKVVSKMLKTFPSRCETTH